MAVSDLVAGMDMTSSRTLLVITCLILSGLTGCVPTSPETPSPPSTSQSATAVPPSPGPQTNPVDRDLLQNGGDLRVGVASQASSWNPWDNSPFNLDPVLDAMTPRFFATGADGGLQWDSAWLASEPEVTSEPGSMSVSYVLNPRAVWSDGTAISVADFQATWRACTSGGPMCADRGFEHVAGIESRGGQIVVTYDGPYAEWAYTFARGPSRAETVVDHDPWYDLSGRQASFSGPYVYSSVSATGVKLVRNPLWWDVYPKLDSIEVHVIADPVLSYLRQEIDGFWVADANLFARASAIDGIVVRRSISPAGRYVVMNCGSGPLADPVVRQAVLRGLDRTRLSASDLAGWKWEGSVVNSPVWLTSQEQYVDLVTTAKTPFDLKTAATLLDEDGWIQSDSGVRFKNGVALKWDFLVPTGDPIAENEGFGLRVQLADLGVELDLRYVDPGDEQDADGMVGVTWLYTTPVSAASRYATGNDFAYSSDTVDSLLARTQDLVDPVQQVDLLNGVADLVWSEAPVLPLYEFPEVFFVRDGLANYGPSELGTILWENVGWS